MIKNLKEKLNGNIPVTRLELLEIVSSWGRKYTIFTLDDLKFDKCEPKECYPLENLDVSQITDFSYIFSSSYYNGDLSKWDISKSLDCSLMFCNSDLSNDSLKNWDTSKVINMDGVFYNSKFNGDLSGWNLQSCKDMKDMFAYSNFNNNSISNWDISNVIDMVNLFSTSAFAGDISSWNFNIKNEYFSCYNIVFNNKNFKEKYNDGNSISYYTEDFIEWFEKNRDKMKEINMTKEEILDFFSFDDKKLELNN